MKKITTLFIPAILLITASVALAAEPVPSVYQVTLRFIEAQGTLDPASFQVPLVTADTKEEEFLEALSSANPGATLDLLYSLSATTLAGLPASMAVQDDEGSASATVTPTPVEGGILVSLECSAQTGSRILECNTTSRVTDGEGYLIGGLSSSAGSRLILLSVCIFPVVEEGGAQ